MDCLIVGAGVIGLSLAYELAGHGLKVRLIDRGEVGREASWAGAGMLPPIGGDVQLTAYERLIALSNRLHHDLSAALLEQTGIDNGYRRCGAVYLAFTAEQASELGHLSSVWRQRDVSAKPLSTAMLRSMEPELNGEAEPNQAVFVTDECQLRNPRHLKALAVACAARGVEIQQGVECEDFEVIDGRISKVITSAGPTAAGMICLTPGSFGRRLGIQLGVQLHLKPIRGQITLLSMRTPLLSCIVNVGKRYLVPRADGRVLIGATEEDVGFNRGTTAAALLDLLSFGTSLVPRLRDATVERQWSGFRPGTADGLPYLGKVPDLKNAFVATGHFRSGLQLSTGTAAVMSELMRGQNPSIELSDFRLNRH